MKSVPWTFQLIDFVICASWPNSALKLFTFVYRKLRGLKLKKNIIQNHSLSKWVGRCKTMYLYTKKALHFKFLVVKGPYLGLANQASWWPTFRQFKKLVLFRVDLVWGALITTFCTEFYTYLAEKHCHCTVTPQGTVKSNYKVWQFSLRRPLHSHLPIVANSTPTTNTDIHQYILLTSHKHQTIKWSPSIIYAKIATNYPLIHVREPSKTT